MGDEQNDPQAIDEGEELLEPEEKAEQEEQKQFDSFVGMADQTLNHWHEAQDEQVRQGVIDNFIDSGELDHEAAGVEEIEAQVVVAAFTQHVARNILKPLGLTFSQWETYVAESDLAAFRRAAVKGEWSAFHGHAQAVASHIHQHGDVNAET